ncbi:MAG: bifunctional glutamate N-acetyltransferase/amino-acid acetyltransferase ArgJ [Zetaproteobacteria bacterium]|nr:MAG: bifunctional glutamate N-acetyltransferase/amino-acid acetyltransferase ArgJ [Zetaproteobacteria bacterium]
MAVNPPLLDPPLPVPCFRVGTASCGVKSPEIRGKRQDLTLIVSDEPAHAAGVFTQNRFRAACVDFGQETIERHGQDIRCIIANSGNANAGVGEMERLWAQQLIEAGAAACGCRPEQTLSASTGVIGTPFPIERIERHIGEAVASLRPDGWQAAAEAIRTTDTFAKWASRKVGNHTITGIAKGSGMIHPNMATMLAFVATDAPLTHDQLQPMLRRAADRSFNSISVDGDTSTNDTVYLLANGLGMGHAPLQDTSEFEQALTEVCIELAQLIVRDGEGVSKFVTIHVNGARSEEEARKIGRTIAVSPLVKTAFAGSDANWGRILAAIGNAGVEIDRSRVALAADDVCIVENGQLREDYRDEAGMAVFAKKEFTLHVDLGLGEAAATVWTGDLTHEYITINAEYRT